MQETIYICDCCKAKADVQQMSIAIRSYTDNAGSRDTENVDFELCVGCMGRFALHLLMVLKTNSSEATLTWLKSSNTDYRKG